MDCARRLSRYVRHDVADVPVMSPTTNLPNRVFLTQHRRSNSMSALGVTRQPNRESKMVSSSISCSTKYFRAERKKLRLVGRPSVHCSAGSV